MPNFEDFGQVVYDADMRKYTTLGVGGRADILVIPDSCEKLAGLLKECMSAQQDVTVIGGGSKIVVRDGGIRGVTILTRRLTKVSFEGETLTAEAGAKTALLARQSADRGLKGLEWACGIPGTCGGAICGNAGAYGGCIGDIVSQVTVFEDGKIRRYSGGECGFGYRKSIFSGGGRVILSARLKMKTDSKAELLELMAAAERKRTDSQPGGIRTAGSTFKALKQGAAGRLIDLCGLKGYRIGGIKVNEKHANFFENCGGGTAAEMLKLMEHVRKAVYDRFSEQAEYELKIIGEDIE